MAGACQHHTDTRNSFRVLFENPQKSIPLARGRCWWDGIEVVLREIACEDINWIELTSVTGLSRNYLKTVMNLCGD
jgi:hypothetical protein